MEAPHVIQFRIRTFFAVTLAFAGLFACLFAMPDVIGCLLLAVASLAMLPLIAAGVYFGRGTLQAFAIGAATLSWLTILLNLGTIYVLVSSNEVNRTTLVADMVDSIRLNSLAFKTLHLANALLLGLAGGLSVAVRAYLMRSREQPTSETRPEEQVIAPQDSAPVAGPKWRLLRMDGSHSLAGPTLGGDQPVASSGNAPDSSEDDRPIRRPR